MSLESAWGKAKEALDAAILALAQLVRKHDAIESAIHGSDPAPAIAPAPLPVTVPAPLPVTVPDTGWVEEFATCWLGADDASKNGAYGPLDPAKPLFSLPGPFHADDRLEAMDVVTGRTALLERGDIGPWQTRDSYWTTGRQPLADTFKGQTVRWSEARGGWFPDGEGKKTLTCNGAGIDISPGGWALLRGISCAEAYDHPPAGRVRFRVIHGGAAPTPVDVPGAALALVGRPFPYAPGTEAGVLGCADVVSTVLINAGALKGAPLLSVDALSAKLKSIGWTVIAPPGPWSPGDVIVWDEVPESNHHKHVGVAISAVEVVQNVSRDKAVERTAFGARPILYGLRRTA